MKPILENPLIINGDCLKAMKAMEANSMDALVTDPPAGISFMGTEWDSNKGGTEQWIWWMTGVMCEALRVLKPGAHGLVWALPRTSHWTATALERAGFEVRDVITHCFGTGFPKSLDVSKAIDKAAGAERPIIGTAGRSGSKRNCMSGNYTGGDYAATDAATDAAKKWQGFGTALKPATERWILCRKPKQSDESLEKTDTCNAQEWAETFLSIDASWKNILAAVSPAESMSTIKTASDLITALRTLRFLILGLMQASTIPAEILVNGQILSASDAVKNLANVFGQLSVLSTISAQDNVSDLAAISLALTRWHRANASEQPTEPLSEDYILVRKPLSEKTVAANVLKHGTGGLNIDGSRISTGGEVVWKVPESDKVSESLMVYDKPGAGSDSMFKNKGGREGTPLGRFPSNLVFSHNDDCDDACTEGCAVAMLNEQSGGASRFFATFKGEPCDANSAGMNLSQPSEREGFAQSHVVTKEALEDSASRFTYCAKASKSDRGTDNGHPCVKSSKLMSYLIKLVTPPGGTVLDPFAGSGSTGVAAKREGFGFVGIEKNAEYAEIAKARLESA